MSDEICHSHYVTCNLIMGAHQHPITPYVVLVLTDAVCSLYYIYNVFQGTYISYIYTHVYLNFDRFMLKCCRLLRLIIKKDRNIPISHSQYHGCWWPGDARSQGISSHDIDLFYSRIIQALLSEGVKNNKDELSHVMIWSNITYGIAFTTAIEPGSHFVLTKHMPCLCVLLVVHHEYFSEHWPCDNQTRLLFELKVKVD